MTGPIRRTPMPNNITQIGPGRAVLQIPTQFAAQRSAYTSLCRIAEWGYGLMSKNQGYIVQSQLLVHFTFSTNKSGDKQLGVVGLIHDSKKGKPVAYIPEAQDIGYALLTMNMRYGALSIEINPLLPSDIATNPKNTEGELITLQIEMLAHLSKKFAAMSASWKTYTGDEIPKFDETFMRLHKPNEAIVYADTSSRRSSFEMAPIKK